MHTYKETVRKRARTLIRSFDMGNLCEIHWGLWETHGRSMRDLCEIYGKSIGSLEVYVKFMGNLWECNRFSAFPIRVEDTAAAEIMT